MCGPATEVPCGQGTIHGYVSPRGRAVGACRPLGKMCENWWVSLHGRERPAPLNRHVSAQMRKMPRHSTRPEMLLRRELHRRGARFRVHPDNLPGRPDIAFTRARLAIFIDGCFWHMCERHGSLPKNNRDWWQEKLLRNVGRDLEKDEALRKAGWTPMHVWEHTDPTDAADEIERLWRSAPGCGPRDRAARGDRDGV